MIRLLLCQGTILPSFPCPLLYVNKNNTYFHFQTVKPRNELFALLIISIKMIQDLKDTRGIFAEKSNCRERPNILTGIAGGMFDFMSE